MPNPETQSNNIENQNKSAYESINQPDGIGAKEESAGESKRTSLMNRAEAQVRENEDASLQDDSYTFDSDNTDSDEGVDDFDVEDVGGGMSDFDVDNNDDYV